MRRLERGAGRRRGRRTGPQIRQPAPGNSGPRAGAAPAGVLTHSAHSGGVGAPPGDTTVSCQELADGGARAPQKARPDAVRRTPQQSAERRAGLRHWPVISGDPEMGATARRAIRCGASAPAPVGVLLPSFSRAENRRGAPAPTNRAGAALAFRRGRPSRKIQNPKTTEETAWSNHMTSAPARSISETGSVHSAVGATCIEHVARVRQHGVPPRALLPRQAVALLPENFPRLPEGVQDWFALMANSRRTAFRSTKRGPN